MKLLDYIRGQRKGKEAHRLEKEAMKDPFLADAMDEYQMVEGKHEERLNILREQINAHSNRKQKRAVIWSIAASFMIGISISGYFLFQKDSLTEKSYTEDKAASVIFEQEIIPTEPERPNTLAKTTPTDTVKKTTSHLISESRTRKVPSPSAAAPIPETDECITLLAEEDIQAEVADTEALPMAEHKNRIRGVAATRAINEIVNPIIAKDTIITAKEGNVTPKPVIGKKKYRKYLKENLVRPAKGECANVKGKVVITFFINENGRPFDLSVKESLCPDADKEAMRLIEEGPNWTQGDKRASVIIKF